MFRPSARYKNAKSLFSHDHELEELKYIEKHEWNDRKTIINLQPVLNFVRKV